jgi:hypothetical protein
MASKIAASIDHNGSGSAEYIAKLRAEQDPRLLLAASDQYATKALACAENPDMQNADMQNAALIYARAATAKAIAAVAAAILERPERS